MANESYIQIGVTALRDKMGNFLPSVPLYVKASDAMRGCGQDLGEDPLKEIAKIFAAKYADHVKSREASRLANA